MIAVVEIPETVDLPAMAVQLVGVFVIPLLVGLATKLRAHPGVKAIASILISGLLVAPLQTIVANGGHLEFRVWLPTALIDVAGAVIAYLGFWQPIGGGVADPVSLATPKIGLGAEVRSVPARAA